MNKRQVFKLVKYGEITSVELQKYNGVVLENKVLPYLNTSTPSSDNNIFKIS